MTKGRLKLDEVNTEKISEVTYHYPTWTTQSTDARTVDILNTDNPSSYGIIAEEVRYIDDMPYNWQPDGLQKDDEGKGVAANALCAADHHQAYVYFIPNDAGLSLTCTVYYTKIGSTGEPQNVKSTAESPVVISPLRGNRTYQLNLEIDPTP